MLMNLLFCFALCSLMITTCIDGKNSEIRCKPMHFSSCTLPKFNFLLREGINETSTEGVEFYKSIKSFNKILSSKLNKNSLVNYGNPFYQCLKYLYRFIYRILSSFFQNYLLSLINFLVPQFFIKCNQLIPHHAKFQHEG